MKFNLPRRTFLQKFLQYSVSALALVSLSVAISSKIVEAQNTTKKTGIKTKVVRLAYQTSGDIVKIKGVVDKRLQPLGIKV
jgi:sulfonate transport system substrate-binding protein